MHSVRASVILVSAAMFFSQLSLAATSSPAPTQPIPNHLAPAPTNTPTSGRPAPLHPQVDAAEKMRIQEVVHQYLLQNPEVIVEALQVFQHKQYEEAEQTIKNTQQNANQFVNALFKQTNDPIAGNPNGTIMIVEFFDYQCPHCIEMVPVMDAIIKSNPDVKIIYKDFPVRGPLSELAARAAIAANKQQKYSAFSHALLTSNKPIDEAAIYQIAQTVNMDVEKLKKDMADPSINKQLLDNVKLAQDLKLFGTPAFFIAKAIPLPPASASAGNALPAGSHNIVNINYVPGQMTQAQLQAAINQAKK